VLDKLCNHDAPTTMGLRSCRKIGWGGWRDGDGGEERGNELERRRIDESDWTLSLPHLEESENSTGKFVSIALASSIAVAHLYLEGFMG
jgi:hypothetical protein